ncbi:hypothetical protein J6590_023806 [Homalodisca vitripennis]|nr:hypothetical protein J6590_092276 [Homalodisca vitripennis]KAG8273296.1 hypothetical protein J6590_023806 [Homalodisca vitripennis]
MLSRSNTWPVVVVRLEEGRPSTQLEPLKKEEVVPAAVVCPTIDSRKATTLYRHYYLEGGWGWVVITVSVLVHLLCHGLQLSWGILMEPTARRFTTTITDTGLVQADDSFPSKVLNRKKVNDQKKKRRKTHAEEEDCSFVW